MRPLLLLLTLISSSPLAASLGVEVEDVTGRQLEAALQTEELVAVMFCKSLQSWSHPVVPRPLAKLSQLAGLEECFHFNLISAQCCVTNSDKPPPHSLPSLPPAPVLFLLFTKLFKLLN